MFEKHLIIYYFSQKSLTFDVIVFFVDKGVYKNLDINLG